MHSLDLPLPTCTTPPEIARQVAERADSELRRNGYVALKNINCEYQDGTLVLTGCLPTYYLKQMAQEAVAHLNGVERVDNRIEVMSVTTRFAYRF